MRVWLCTFLTISHIFQRGYMDAVKEVYDMDKFHIHKRAMDTELKEAPAFLTMRQQASCFNLELFCRFICITR